MLTDKTSKIKKTQIMFGGESREDLVKFAKANTALTLVLFANILITITSLVFAFSIWKDRVVVQISLPGQTLYAAPNRASDSTFELWGRYLIDKVARFSPPEIKKNASEFDQKIDPDAYSKMSDELKSFAQGVYFGGLTQKYEGCKYKVETDKSGRNAVVRASGRATRTASTGQIIFDKSCEYAISLTIREGDFYVTGMSTSCK